MSKHKITTRAFNFPEWYQDVISAAPDLYDESPVTGSITFGPLATQIWQNIRDFLDVRLKHMGVQNIMLPLFIPEHFFEREKEHVEGFAPEVAVVTHAGGEELPEPYYVRPTSELLFVDWFAREGKVQSHRDLPLLANQWCSVVRWEKRPRAFLRTTEFHWHEGHCLFLDEDQCRTFSLAILDLFSDLVEGMLAIPTVKGEKPAHELFPGALTTYTIESMMQDGKALQMGTSHVLSQDFLKDSDGKPIVSFLNKEGKQDIPFYDSWAVSTRLIGAIIMSHGDDEGIVLPPKIAPVQCAVISIFGPEEKENENVLKAARDIALKIANAPHPFPESKRNQNEVSNFYQIHGRTHAFEQADGHITVQVDNRKDTRLGEKTFHQIRAGTPVRVEIGARELMHGMCIIKSRIRSKDDALKVPFEQAPDVVSMLLRQDQDKLFANAKTRMEGNIIRPADEAELKKTLNEGLWAEVAWDGSNETVTKLKTDTSGGTYRCFPFDSPLTAKGEKDVMSGKPSPFAKHILVAKAY